jgi:hypothetical protein
MLYQRRGLILAGTAGLVSLGLAISSLTITALAAIFPPRHEFLTEAENARLVGNSAIHWIAAAASVLVAVLVLVQVATRRPLWRMPATSARTATSNAGLAVFLVVALVVCAMCVQSVVLWAESAKPATSHATTMNLPLRSLAAPLGTMSIMCAVIGSQIFTRWWYQTHPRPPL